MTLHADFYADQATHHVVNVVENIRIAEATYRLRFRCPEIAEQALPGQFLMLRLDGLNDPLIGRPLAVYDVTRDEHGQPSEVDVVYIVKGKLTSWLEFVEPGQQIGVWGPLGNGFLPEPTQHLIMVAGGIGQTPFLALAQEYLGINQFGTPPRVVPACERVTFCYGARAAKYLAGVEDFKEIGVDTRLATDDGSTGHHGLVTDVLTSVLDESPGDRRIVCCGPEPMMEAVAGVAADYSAPCRVSLETPMACGIGICFTCVAMVRDECGEADYKRTCVEGPVFDATKIVW